MTKSMTKIFPVYLSLCLFGIIFGVSGFREQSSTVWDKLYFSFYGISGQGFSLGAFFYYCIVYIGFTYLFQIYLSVILTERIYYQLIRHRSLYQWFWTFIRPVIFRIILLLFSLFFITIVVGMFEGKSLKLSLTVVENSSVSMLVFHFFVNGFLQMMNYVLITFLILWVWKESEYGLLTLGALMVSSLPMLKLRPSGLNSLGNITGNEYDLYKITILLLFYLVIEIIIIWYLLRKRSVTF